MLIKFCCAILLATSGAAFADGTEVMLPPPSNVDFWQDDRSPWAQLEYEWRREFKTYLRLIQAGDTRGARGHHRVLLGILGRLNALAQEPLHRDEHAVERAMGHIVVQGSRLVQQDLNFYDAADVATLRTLFMYLREDAQSPWKLISASRAALAPEKRRFYALRSVFFGGGLIATESVWWTYVRAVHSYPSDTSSLVALAVGAVAGGILATVTAREAPRGPRFWDYDVVSATLENCERALARLRM